MTGAQAAHPNTWRGSDDAIPQTLPRATAFGPTALLTATLLLPACAVYEEAQPGRYSGLGQLTAGQICNYEAPTGLLISQWRCRKREDVVQGRQDAKEMLESIPTNLPPPPR